ncbi:flavin-containing amine oxidoreductase-domain containing protein [Lactarius indigo]|nr:flavin-containing amine oxidoreductase-domain containing protein [Lactarius indigo]
MNLAVACTALHSAPDRQLTVELGANWIHGTQEGGGPANPVFELALKHNLKTAKNDPYTSITTYDAHGAVDYFDVVHNAMDAYTQFTIAAGARLPENLVDLTARAGYALIGQKPKTPHEIARNTSPSTSHTHRPEQSSFLASAWGSNFTYNVDQGGFSEDNLLQLISAGLSTSFKRRRQSSEAVTGPPPSHCRNNRVLRLGGFGHTHGWDEVNAQYAICTFSLGVLQHDDVQFVPPLPEWKVEAIHSLTMATYTKIFLQFPQKFWFDTEFAVYADSERGRYPIWQSLDLDGFAPGSGVIFATVTGDYSKRIEAMTDAQVQSEVMQVLRAMFPNVAIPEPMLSFPALVQRPALSRKLQHLASELHPTAPHQPGYVSRQSLVCRRSNE